MLADSALHGDQLDEAAALAARERAREALEGRRGEVDSVQAQAELVEAEARYRAAQQLKGNAQLRAGRDALRRLDRDAA